MTDNSSFSFSVLPCFYNNYKKQLCSAVVKCQYVEMALVESSQQCAKLRTLCTAHARVSRHTQNEEKVLINIK